MRGSKTNSTVVLSTQRTQGRGKESRAGKLTERQRKGREDTVSPKEWHGKNKEKRNEVKQPPNYIGKEGKTFKKAGRKMFGGRIE